MSESILLALEDPRDQDTVLPFLWNIARAMDAHVIVMQSVPFLETVVEMPHELSPEVTGDDEASKLFVSGLVGHLRSEGFSAEGFTNVGLSGLTIAAAADRTEASLVLMALRHPKWIQSLVRITPTPVLAVPVRRRPPAARILVPINDPSSLEMIPTAAAMARIFTSELTLVGSEPHALLPQARERARLEGIPTSEVAVDADEPALALLELPAMMIVMRPSPDEAVRRLVRESDVPLLLARRPLPMPDRGAAWLPPARVDLWRRRISSNPIQGIGEP